MKFDFLSGTFIIVCMTDCSCDKHGFVEVAHISMSENFVAHGHG